MATCHCENAAAAQAGGINKQQRRSLVFNMSLLWGQAVLKDGDATGKLLVM